MVIGAFARDTLVGVAGLAFESREKAKHKATLFGMYVPAAHRNRGLGRRLVIEALAKAKDRPATRLVQLTVTDGNAAAEALYASCGFVRFGVEPFAVAVEDRFVAKVHMWCDLERPALR
jgi:RimJ/RimL family protein N-acetyltransferase